MATRNNIQEIRFNGFTGDFEQCKFWELGNVSIRIFKEYISENGDIPF